MFLLILLMLLLLLLLMLLILLLLLWLSLVLLLLVVLLLFKPRNRNGASKRRWALPRADLQRCFRWWPTFVTLAIVTDQQAQKQQRRFQTMVVDTG